CARAPNELTSSRLSHAAAFITLLSDFDAVVRRSVARIARNLPRRADYQFLFDALIDLALGKLGGHPDRVADRVGVGAPVTDDADAADAEQGRSAVLRIIETLLEILECGARDGVADLSRNGGFQRVAQQRLHHIA